MGLTMGYILWVFIVLIPVPGAKEPYPIVMGAPDKTVCEQIRIEAIKSGNLVEGEDCKSLRVSN